MNDVAYRLQITPRNRMNASRRTDDPFGPKGWSRRPEKACAVLTAFGAGAVTLMMLCYAMEQRAAIFTLCFALACFAASAYGWLAGTWPFGVVEFVWGCVALRKWFVRRANA